MPHTPKDPAEAPAELLPDFNELCRVHDVSPELIERSEDLDDLLERILAEYEARLAAGKIETRRRIENLGEVLETLGALAHKINNPLTALLGRAQLLQAVPDADPRVKKTVSVIGESATRIAGLVRELADVVQQGKAEAMAQLRTSEDGLEPPESGT
jgi:signal transduction histidine kinase